VIARARGQAASDRRDGLAGNRDVRREGAAAGRDRSAADEEVVGLVGHFKLRAGSSRQSMIPKSGYRFSEKIILQ